MSISIGDLMARSGVKFGTSGARGLATDMTDSVCHAYTLAFLQYLRDSGDLRNPAGEVAVGGDLRPSTGRIMGAVCAGVRDFGARPVNCGRIPSPAVALYGFARGIPSIMVTGSHIPDDRNGIKFNKPRGEVLKPDEAGIMAQRVELGEPGAAGAPAEDPTAGEEYLRRYLAAFPGRPLSGWRIGVYQHSAVGRDLLSTLLRGLGADAVPLGRSERFLPVDTEAIRPEDIRLGRDWAAQGRWDALVSTDGDSDRPLIGDERGEWLRGDVAGILCARFLGADAVVTPVSSNTAVERCGWFAEVRRTRIGSPFVVEGMGRAAEAGCRRVVGYEANGGFLLQTDVARGGGVLTALPTRDAVLPILGVLLFARECGQKVSDLVRTLPQRHTASDRLKEFPVERGRAVMGRFLGEGGAGSVAAVDGAFGELVGSRATGIDTTDGVRATFANEEILHLRPSGNAPEFRGYAEAATEERAVALCRGLLSVIEALR